MKKVKCYLCSKPTDNWRTTKIILDHVTEKKIATTLCGLCDTKIRHWLSNPDDYLEWLDQRKESRKRGK